MFIAFDSIRFNHLLLLSFKFNNLVNTFIKNAAKINKNINIYAQK